MRVPGTTVRSEPVGDGRRRLRLMNAIVVNGECHASGDVVDVIEQEAMVLIATRDAQAFVEDDLVPVRHSDPVVSRRR